MTRYDRLLDDLLKKHRHASEQQILACLDGELSARQSEWVRRHLEGCWRCRSLSEQIGQTVGGFIEYRQQYLTSTAKNSNEGWPALKARLRQSSPPRPRSLPSRFLAVPALAVLALAFFYLRLSSTEPVSAATALENARRSEQGATSPNGFLSYRKLAIRRRSGEEAVQTGTYEVWADGRTSRVRRSGSEPLLAEVEAVFAANQRVGPPLSASGFANWRSGVNRKREAVVAGERTGAEVVTIRTEVLVPLSENAIRDAELVLRTDNWTPVAESFSVAGKEEARQYEFDVVEVRMVDRRWLPEESAAPDISATGSPVAEPTLRAKLIERAPATTDEGLANEIAAQYALHRAGASLDGAVDVIRRPGGILVRGVVESAQRKAELESALAEVPDVTVQIEIPGTTAAVPAPPAEGGDFIKIEARTPRLNQKLAEYFETNTGPGSPSDRAAEMANRAISHTREIRRHAWALRRLTERFAGSPGVLSRIRSVQSRWLLEVMIRDYVNGVDKEAAALSELLDRLLRSIGTAPERDAGPPLPGGSWPSAAGAVFEGQQEIEKLVHQLFGDEAEDGTPGEIAGQLRTRLAIFQQQSALLSEQAARMVANPHLEETVP